MQSILCDISRDRVAESSDLFLLFISTVLHVSAFNSKSEKPPMGLVMNYVWEAKQNEKKIQSSLIWRYSLMWEALRTYLFAHCAACWSEILGMPHLLQAACPDNNTGQAERNHRGRELSGFWQMRKSAREASTATLSAVNTLPRKSSLTCATASCAMHLHPHVQPHDADSQTDT